MMAVLRSGGPCIWVTWLTRLLAGENSCEWAAWFRAQHEGWSWAKAPSGFDLVGWQLAHTAGVNECRAEWEGRGYTVYTESQNSFALRGRTATLGGKPDLIAPRGGSGTIIDVKTRSPSPAHSVQVMLYMYAVPRSMGQHNGVAFDGRVAYGDHEVVIPASAVNETFIGNLVGLVRRLSASEAARRVPSPRECGFCDISSADCPQRVAGGDAAEGVTEDF